MYVSMYQDVVLDYFFTIISISKTTANLRIFSLNLPTSKYKLEVDEKFFFYNMFFVFLLAVLHDDFFAVFCGEAFCCGD